jgi:hypothetical protein
VTLRRLGHRGIQGIGDGALIEVNGDTGTVTILEHAAEPAVR